MDSQSESLAVRLVQQRHSRLNFRFVISTLQFLGPDFIFVSKKPAAAHNGLTPHEYICKIWTSEPDSFIVNPIHQTPGLTS